MSLAGPRLDRPSAIGDEGRPRAASLWIASLAVIVVVGVVGVAIDLASLLPTLGLVVGMTVAGVGLLERDGFVNQVVAHLFLLTFGSAFALAVLAAPFVSRVGLAVSGSALALAGIAAAWADVGGDTLKPAAIGSAISYVSMLCAAVLAAVLAVIVFFGWTVLTGIVGVSTPVASLTGFLMIVAAIGGAIGLALRWLPIRQLTRRDRRPAVERRLAIVRRRLLYTVAGSVAAIAGIAVLVIAGVFEGAIRSVPGLAVALEALSSPFVVWPIVAVGVGAVGLGVVAVGLRRFTRQVTAETTRRTAAITVGVVLSLPFLLGLALLIASSGAVVGPFLLGSVLLVPLLLGPLAFLAVIGGSVAAVGLGLLPARATGPAIAATGLVVAAIGLGRASPLVVFACIATAVLVWDTATFGLGVTAELGHLPDTRRLELFHGTVAVGIAVAAVVLVTGLELLRAGLFGSASAAGAAVVVLGALLLLVPLRG
ncbi:hypothetical protein [Natrinema longum]|uniref:Uncharacterized protein n=1 Tax=Natrinema longum TaxID=370324 RepID=A0A8A2U688_9EURY|nr:hypothetical protein [Natrinema longum]MBZ6494917.1 hypothetical protein [Natrinema longum]QSW83785.1 hypothetical protein J0X27_09845 [Natrinema longum]